MRAHIPGYRVGELLGEGGMGEVHAAQHLRTGSEVAIKVLRPKLRNDRVAVRALVREGRVAQLVVHANLVRAFHCGVLSDGRPFFVMERLWGNDLAVEQQRFGTFSPASATRIAIDVLRGLAALHRAGYVHSDIKPENVFVDATGRARLLDYGLVTEFDQVVPFQGTPRWMAPERFVGGRSDLRSDLYSVGLVLFALLAGEGPFDAHASDPEVLSLAHRKLLPPGIRTIAAQWVPDVIEDVVARALKKHPGERFASSEEMARALGARETSPRLAPARLDASQTTPHHGARVAKVARGPYCEAPAALA